MYNMLDAEREERLREQAFEEIANFGKGAELINVITGERWIAGKRQQNIQGGI